MENTLQWKQIIYDSESSKAPLKRWGHRTCYIQNQIILFGGFSDTKYLNDLWSYNFKTNTWKEVITSGQKPQPKSNCTMHYDNVNNQIMLYGGGGSNKARFNKISLLNWQTKVWRQVKYQSDDNIPWQRTYHSSQFKYPYLITYGGEGVANLDFDDFWIFNIETEKWTEIHCLDQNKISLQNRPKARRFHQTVIIGNIFYVVGGCYASYICLSEVYSIDLSHFFSKKEQKMEWKKLKFSPQQERHIEKWGHSLDSYNGKIYLFGGRNQVDFNDLVQIDPQQLKIKVTKSEDYSDKIPKCRRKHSSCLIGSSLIIFGGFNNQYYSDMHYIFVRQTLSEQIKHLTNVHRNYEVIELEKESFKHFMIQNSKSKNHYDLQLIVKSRGSQKIMESSSNILPQKSVYFKNLLNSHQTNPQKKSILLNLEKEVNLQSFKIFHNFLMKDILVVSTQITLQQISQLLFLSDYFLGQSFKQLCEMLIFKKINFQFATLKQLIKVFNISIYWRLQTISKICASAIIFSQQYKDNQYSNKNIFHKLCLKKGQTLLQGIIQEERFGFYRQSKIKKSLFSKNCLLNLTTFKSNKVKVSSVEKEQNKQKQKQTGFFGNIMKSIKNIRKNSNSESEIKENETS